MKRCNYLILDDGSLFPGVGFGAEAQPIEELQSGSSAGSAGEVVFNTGMAGYQEMLTDPSYAGQLVAMTYPLIGNYGTSPGWNETGPEKGVQRRKIKAEGFIVRQLYRGGVPAGADSLDSFLKRHGIAGIEQVDTRRLTLHLRDGGARNGVIVSAQLREEGPTQAELERARGFLAACPLMEGRGLLGAVGTARAESLQRGGSPHLAVVDCGVKAGILAGLEALGARLSILPSTAGAGEVLNLRPDAVLFSNGPGDPAVLAEQIEAIRGLIGKLPVFGICLGHQLIALALGAGTYKLKFGHHGVNNPVVDLANGRVYVTSQNHGFAVDEASLPAGMEVWFRNANDASIEGLRHKELPVACVQFHPEACPGPDDTRWILGDFLKRI